MACLARCTGRRRGVRRRQSHRQSDRLPHCRGDACDAGAGRLEDVMNSAFLVAGAAALAALSGYGLRTQDLSAHEDSQANSEEAGVFSQWLTSDAPECVPVSEIGSVSHLAKLTAGQFQFVRALYIAIPPVS